jgi:Zn-dependent protease
VFDLRRIILNLIPMLLSLTVHEFAHAWVANRLGDDTPRRQGRLTLSPLAHYDVMGTFVIPAISTMLGGYALIGWAKPVEVNPGRMTRKLTMRKAMALVAVAGPASNLALSVLAAAVMALLLKYRPELLIGTGIGELLQAMFLLNIGLCVFNLLPIPPLDGSRLLPRNLDSFKEAVAPYSFLLMLLVLNIAPLRQLLLDFPIRVLGSLIGVAFSLPI